MVALIRLGMLNIKWRSVGSRRAHCFLVGPKSIAALPWSYPVESTDLARSIADFPQGLSGWRKSPCAVPLATIVLS
jgi:hypothetical protein